MSQAPTFAQIFQAPSQVKSVSPGRINLIGEHIDYLGGCVLPAAIHLETSVEARVTTTGALRLWSDTFHTETPLVLPLESLAPIAVGQDYWANYPAGVVDEFRQLGWDCPGLDLRISSDLPSGAGMSSSAALETAVALLCESFANLSLSPMERALLCQRAEHAFPKVPCGIMDQVAVGMGRADHGVLLDCQFLDVKTIPLPDDVVIISADTGVKHALGDGEYGLRKEQCQSALEILGYESFRDVSSEYLENHKGRLTKIEYCRASHVVGEMQRVERFADLLRSGDVSQLREVMLESHISLRDDFEVSCPELDRLIEHAYALGPEYGLLGARMTGGGFGGATVNLVRRDAVDRFCEALSQRYNGDFEKPVTLYQTKAADGARIVSEQLV